MHPPPAPESTNLIELAPGVRVRPADLRYSFSRSSGPGGQAVNKVNTQAELRIAITALDAMPHDALARLRRLAGRRLTLEDEIVVQASTTRSQLDNRRAALARLSELVARAMIRPKPRRPTRTSRAAKQKRLTRKRELGEKKRRRRRAGDD